MNHNQKPKDTKPQRAFIIEPREMVYLWRIPYLNSDGSVAVSLKLRAQTVGNSSLSPRVDIGVATVNEHGAVIREVVLSSSLLSETETPVHLDLSQDSWIRFPDEFSEDAAETWLFARSGDTGGSVLVETENFVVTSGAGTAKLECEASASAVLAEFCDNSGATYAEVLRDGDYRFSGKRLGGLFGLIDVHKPAHRAPVTRFSQMRKDFSDILSNLRNWKGSNAIAPVPLAQVAETWELFDTESFLATQIQYKDVSECVVDTPYFENGQVVHPYVAQFYGHLLGESTIMMLTDYHETNDKYEDPSIYGVDETSFRLLKEPPQPLATPNTSFSNNYNSDPFLYYDFHNGVLVFCWRNGSRATGFSLMARETVDGVHWSDPYTFYPTDKTRMLLSPCALYTPEKDLYSIYAINRNELGQVKFSFCWMSPERQFSQWHYIETPFPVWHAEVKRLGSGFIGVFNDNYHSRQLFLGYSNDGMNWQFADRPLLAGEFEPSYKASIAMNIKTISDWQCKANLEISLYWTTSNRGRLPKSKHWRMRFAQFATPIVRI